MSHIPRGAVGSPVRAWRGICRAAACLLWLGTAQAQPADAGAAASPPIELKLTAPQMRALQRATEAVVGVQVTAVEGAKSARSLGAERTGSGVVIEDGLVLTIGYLILEAQDIWLQTPDNRRVPAQALAYDQATGFGLVRALVPLKLEPVALAAPAANSLAASGSPPLAVASGGDGAEVSLARLVSRRAYSGYWEYHIEGALFTAPARRDHSGAALFNAQGELLGVGSLWVNDGTTPGVPGQPANMFVPVELLRPILPELRTRGASAASARAWLGLSCAERDGNVRILRIADDSPAERAGLLAGDRILRIDGTAVSSLAVLWKTLWAGGQAVRDVQLEIQREGEPQTVVVHTLDRAQTLKRAAGI